MKLVLAATMWNNPHMLVLDEPTNYLDRDSLGALASAIQEFQGCVVMISHNSGRLCFRVLRLLSLQCCSSSPQQQHARLRVQHAMQRHARAAVRA